MCFANMGEYLLAGLFLSTYRGVSLLFVIFYRV